MTEKATWFKRKREDEDDETQAAHQTSPRKRQRTEGMEATKSPKDTVTQKGQNENVKGVMFVPYTVGSELAKRMREAETTLQSMTGYRLKIVERSGLKLEDILHKADPWQGQECGREKCLLCLTKTRTGKHLTQDCTRRSLLYETWCMTCQERDIEETVAQAGEDMDKLKHLQDNIRLHKYVGETALSLYERS